MRSIEIEKERHAESGGRDGNVAHNKSGRGTRQEGEDKEEY